MNLTGSLRAFGPIDGVVVEETLVFSLIELCQAAGTQVPQVRALVDEGVLQPSGNAPADWRFDGHALRTTRIALRLSRDLDLGLAAVALVLELLQEIDALHSRLRRGGLG